MQTLACASAVLAVVVAAAVCRREDRERFAVTAHDGRDGYKIFEMRNVLTAAECASLIEHAKRKGLSRSEVVSHDNDTGTALDETTRKSRQTWLSDDEHPAAKKMAAVSADLTGISASHQESLQVAMYAPRGMFTEHYDACVSDDPSDCAKMNKGSGQRRATLLVYLNDDFTGGETEFVNVGKKIHPETGKGILFWNTRDDESLIPDSKHRGNPVLTGEKWIATKWTHQHTWPA